MTKLEVFRRDASIGAYVTLHLTHGDDISGRIDVLEDAYIRLSSEGTTVTIFEELLAGWEVHRANTAPVDAAPALPPPSSQNTTETSSGADSDVLQRFTKIKAEFSIAVDRARLALPEPDFRFAETGFPAHLVHEVRRQWDQARDRYNYALKVNELSRVHNIVTQILAPLQARYPGYPAINALLGCVLLKLNRQSDAVDRLSVAAALSDAPAEWLALAAAARDNTSLQCYALRRRFRLVPPVRAEDAWFRYLGTAMEHGDLRHAAQAVRHWHEQPTTAPDTRCLLSESVLYLLSSLEANAIAMRAAAAQLRDPAELPADWEDGFTNSPSPSEALRAAEDRFVRHGTPEGAASTSVPVLEVNNGSLTGRIVSFGNQRFGFIDSQSGGTHYFRIDDVADQRLRDALLDGTWRAFGTVEFELLPSHGHKYDRATKILPLQDSESLLQRAQHLLAVGQPTQAMGLVRRVLADDPADEAAGRLEQEVKQRITRGLRDGTGLPKGKGPYARAKRAQLVDLDLQKGEALLREAIKQGDKRESAVKDLASLLNQQGRVDEAIVLLENNAHRASTGGSPYQPVEEVCSLSPAVQAAWR